MTGTATGAVPVFGGLSLRDLLVGGAAALAVAVAAPRLVSTLTDDGPDWERILVRSAFADLIGTTFVVTDAAGGELPLQLADVTDLPWSGAAPLHEDQFLATFTGPAGRAVEQGTYQVRHRRLGTFPLFIVPTRPDADGTRRYEAVFNRI
jgi:hypothetical protein